MADRENDGEADDGTVGSVEAPPDTYPDWWRRNVEEFREHDLPPYEPPRFADGELVPPVVSELADELGREVQLRVVDPQAGNRWTVTVDGEAVASINRERHADGYSLFHVTAQEFRRLVREA